MKTQNKAIIALILIAIVAFAGIVAYAWWDYLNNHGTFRPFVYVIYNWDAVSEFRTVTINSFEYHALSPGQNGSVSVVFTSPQWIDHPQTLTLRAQILHDMNGPSVVQHPVPENIELTLNTSSIVLSVNQSTTVELVVDASNVTESGTWYIEIDVSTVSGSTAGVGFNFAIKP